MNSVMLHMQAVARVYKMYLLFAVVRAGGISFAAVSSVFILINLDEIIVFCHLYVTPSIRT